MHLVGQAQHASTCNQATGFSTGSAEPSTTKHEEGEGVSNGPPQTVYDEPTGNGPETDNETDPVNHLECVTCVENKNIERVIPVFTGMPRHSEPKVKRHVINHWNLRPIK